MYNCFGALHLITPSHQCIPKNKAIRENYNKSLHQYEIMNPSAITRLFFPLSNLFSFIRTNVLMCYNLEFEIKCDYNWKQIRNLTSLLIFYLFSFFTGNGCSIKAARSILLEFGSQQITSVHKLLEGRVRQAEISRSGVVLEVELLTVLEQENDNMQMSFKDN